MAGKRIVALGLFALVALTLGLFAASGTEAQSYKPTNSFTVANPVGGAVSNNTQIVRIAAPDYNYEDSSMYSFTPIDWWSPPSAAIPMYAGVGLLSSTATIGTFNGKCATDAPPIFNLWNASVDTSQQLRPDEMAWTNTDIPVPTGNYVAGIPDYLARYPHFLNLMLDPDGPHGPIPPLKPRARYAGDYPVAGSNMLIELVILSPGQIAQLPGIRTQMVSGMGYVFLTMLNNPVDQAEKPGSVSDFCTALMSTTLLYGNTTNNPATAADESGFIATKNPPSNSGVLGSGTHMQRNFSQSERDADGDGWENDFDPCPFTPDPLWQPRLQCTHVGPGDHDCDGLPDSCDPDPQGAPPEPDPIPGTNCVDPNTQSDCDLDGYNNRQDICPLVANGCKNNVCNLNIYNPIWDNQSDEDGKVTNVDLGPSPDSIADVCDDSDCDGVEDAAVTLCSCADGIDNGGDTTIDGNDPDCKPKMDAAELGKCRNDTDDDPADDGTAYGTWINDGCPIKGAAVETDCGPNETLPLDDDADTRVNDGCVTKGATAEPMGVADGAEATIWGTNPGTGLYYQGMTWAAVTINSAIDTDGDGYSDNLEILLGSPENNGGEYELLPATYCPAAANCCNNATDDDGDTFVNDGCPQVGDFAERLLECAPGDNDSDDTAGVGGAPDNRTFFGEVDSGVKVNDGCLRVGVPEDQVIDATLNAPLANPAGDAPKSCNDGVDNDNDGLTDAADPGCSAIPANTASFDADIDGVATAGPCTGLIPREPNDPPLATRTVRRAQPYAAPPGPASDLCLVYNSKLNYPKPPNAFNWWSGLNTPAVTCVPAAPAPSAITAGTLPNGDEGIYINWGAAVIAQGTVCTVTFQTDALPQPLPAPYGESCKTYWSLMGAPIWVDNCPALWNPEQTNTEDVLKAGGAQYPLPAPLPVDTLGDACDTDDDNDLFTDTIESYLGTDPRDNCSDFQGANKSDAWPLDINKDRQVTVVGDVYGYAGKIGAKVTTVSTTWALTRLDLNMDRQITVVGDVYGYAGKIGQKCL